MVEKKLGPGRIFGCGRGNRPSFHITVRRINTGERKERIILPQSDPGDTEDFGVTAAVT